MKVLRFLLTLFISISISQAYSQGMNNANSGQAAVEGFLETSMAKYAIESKELLSYILPSFMASSTCDKVNMYTRIWKYDIEKSQGNFFYVAVFTSPGNRSACILYTFQTQEENGHWYLVPSGVGSYDETFVLPYSDQLHSERSDYVSGSGPYVHTGISDFQTMNNTNSGYAAVGSFMETAMAQHGVNSKELLSYILPSFMVNNSCDKIDMWTKVWKYDIEKTQGNFFYVAIYMEPNYKSSCTLVTFQTQEENGHWYLVPGGVNRYSDEYLDPWVERSADANYIPGTGPYNNLGTEKNEEIAFSEWDFLDNTESDVILKQKEPIKYTKKMAMEMTIAMVNELVQNGGYTILREKTFDKRLNQIGLSFEYSKDELKNYSMIAGIMVYDLEDNHTPPTMLYKTTREGYRTKNKNETVIMEGATPNLKISMIGVRFDDHNLDSAYIEFYNLTKGTYYILVK